MANCLWMSIQAMEVSRREPTPIDRSDVDQRLPKLPEWAICPTAAPPTSEAEPWLFTAIDSTRNARNGRDQRYRRQ